MTKRSMTAFALCVVMLSASAGAQEKQWLAYRTGSDSGSLVGSTPGQTLEMLTQPPDGVALPKFNSEAPLFAKWKSPLAAGGFLWLAVDASRAGGPYDRLFIDSKGDGRLADESPLRADDAKAFRDVQSAEFRQVKLQLPSRDGPITYHLNLQLWIAGSQSHRMVATAGGWYEGDVLIGGKSHLCVLFDANANGVFDDVQEESQLSDILRLDGVSGFALGRVGKYVQVDGKLYALEVAQDGSSIALSEPSAVTMGTVRVTGVQKLSLGGANGLFLLTPEDGVAKVPAGKYRLLHWEIEKKSPAGEQWKLVAAAPSNSAPIEVKPGGEVALDLGEPLLATVAVSSLEKSSYVLSDPALAGRAGERIILTRDNVAPLPQAVITNAAGTYKQNLTFAYG